MIKTTPDTKTAVLEAAIPLFAKRGYDSVSMRDIAQAINIRAPALYNHFKDKQSLYLAAISSAFANKADALSAALAKNNPPAIRLEQFVITLTKLISSDPNFRKLMQRELLDGDEERLQFLAREVFGSSFQEIMKLLEELEPNCDAHLFAISLIGMIQQHYELEPLRRFLPSSLPEHNDAGVIAEHIIQLLSRGREK